MNNNFFQPGFPTGSIKHYAKKKKLLCWSDSVFSTSGFGIVAKNILKALQATGEYDIDQLAINHTKSFYDKNSVPYCIVPARLEDPKDPYGSQMFVSALVNNQYDIVLIINDTFVVEDVANKIEEIRQMKATIGHHDFDLVFYYPVDHPGEVRSHCSMLKVADRVIAYNSFGAETTKQYGNEVTDIIHHGVDTEIFHPLSEEERTYCRQKYWHVDDDTFVLINVNRNTIRKDVAKTILAFSEFKKEVPKSILYLNMRMIDGSSSYLLDLTTCIKELNLNPKTDVIFPTKFNPMTGFDEKILNQFYSSADAYITTHLGEGWGLTVVESLAAGTPVIAPNNTSMPEILGDYGYMYPCKEMTYLDAAGYRPVGRLEDILSSMHECHSEWKTNSLERETRIKKGLEFAKKHSWKNICKSWIELFSSLDRHKGNTTVLAGEAI